MSFVLDASVALVWLVPQSNPDGESYSKDVLMSLKRTNALVPTLFYLEVANVISKLESKQVVTEAQSQHFIALLERLAIDTDTSTSANALGDILNLARRYKISAYDAAYLELALRTGMPISTLDRELTNAAGSAGVALYQSR